MNPPAVASRYASGVCVLAASDPTAERNAASRATEARSAGSSPADATRWAVVAKAAAKLEPAQLRWGSGFAHFVMNRREWTPTGVKLGFTY